MAAVDYLTYRPRSEWEWGTLMKERRTKGNLSRTIEKRRRGFTGRANKIHPIPRSSAVRIPYAKRTEAAMFRINQPLVKPFYLWPALHAYDDDTKNQDPGPQIGVPIWRNRPDKHGVVKKKKAYLKSEPRRAEMAGLALSNRQITTEGDGSHLMGGYSLNSDKFANPNENGGRGRGRYYKPIGPNKYIKDSDGDIHLGRLRGRLSVKNKDDKNLDEWAKLADDTKKTVQTVTAKARTQLLNDNDDNESNSSSDNESDSSSDDDARPRSRARSRPQSRTRSRPQLRARSRPQSHVQDYNDNGLPDVELQDAQPLPPPKQHRQDAQPLPQQRRQFADVPDWFNDQLAAQNAKPSVIQTGKVYKKQKKQNPQQPPRTSGRKTTKPKRLGFGAKKINLYRTF